MTLAYNIFCTIINDTNKMDTQIGYFNYHAKIGVSKLNSREVIKSLDI